MSGILAFLFETLEAAQAAVKLLAGARLVARDFEVDSDLARYGIEARNEAACVLRLHLEPGHSAAVVTALIEQSGGRPIAVPAQESQRLSLEVERLRTEQLWRDILGEYIPLSVAAATTFHQVHGSTRAIVTHRDYDDALNIAAGALASLVPVYSADARGKRASIPVNLVSQRFALGATQLRCADGAVLGNLSVQRADMLFALSIVKRAGLPFRLALLAGERETQENEAPHKSEKP